jgi:hypothetical protein
VKNAFSLSVTRREAMFHIHVPVGLGLVLALGAGSAVWTARLDGKDGSKISGTAQVESIPVMPPSDSTMPPKDTIPPAGTPEELRVTVTLSNAPANASLSWYLYSGSCDASSAGDAESILGVPSSYSPVKVDGSGNGTTTVMIRGAHVAAGNYYVGVLAAGKVAACGNLEPSKTSTDG